MSDTARFRRPAVIAGLATMIATGACRIAEEPAVREVTSAAPTHAVGAAGLLRASDAVSARSASVLLTADEREELDYVLRRAEERLQGQVSLTAIHVQSGARYSFQGERVAPTSAPLRLPVVSMALSLLHYNGTPLDTPLVALIASGDSIATAIAPADRQRYAEHLASSFGSLMTQALEARDGTTAAALLAFLGGASQFDRAYHRSRLPAMRAASITSDALAEVMRRSAFARPTLSERWSLVVAMQRDRSLRRIIAGVPPTTPVERVADEWRVDGSSRIGASDMAYITLPGQRGRAIVTIIVSEADATPAHVDAAMADIARTLYLAWTR